MSRAPVVVLLSVGRNPVSGRPRAAERDARAVAVALATGREVIGLHAGQEDDALRNYFGMGLSHLVTAEVGPGGDPISILSAFLSTSGEVGAILAGSRSEAGEGSGLVPYAVAASLGIPVLPAITAVEIGPNRTRAIQALPGGHRRFVDAPGLAMGIIDLQGPPIRQVARGPATRARIETVPSRPVTSALRLSPSVLADRPARPRPKRIGPGQAAATAGQRLLIRPPAREATLEILRFLEGERIFAPRPTEQRPTLPKGPS